MASIGFAYAQIHAQQKACKEKAKGREEQPKAVVVVAFADQKKNSKDKAPNQSPVPRLSTGKAKTSGGWFSF